MSKFLKLFSDGEFEEAKNYIDSLEHKWTVLIWPCNHGNLEALKWVLENFPDIDVHAADERPFREACREGRFEVAKWLVERFPETNILANNFHAHECAIHNCYPEMGLWLLEKHYKKELAQKFFISLCHRGKLETAKILLEKYPEIDIHVMTDDALFGAFCQRREEVVDWLAQTLKFSPNRTGDFFCHFMFQNRQSEAEFVLEKFPEITFDKDYLYRALCQRGDIKTVRWFLEKFPDTNI